MEVYHRAVAAFLGVLCCFPLGAEAQEIWCEREPNRCVNSRCEFNANYNDYACRCHPGHIPDPNASNVCSRIPACNLLPGSPTQQCVLGTCTQVRPGQFACNCFSGYRLSTQNPNICENIDECSLGSHNCAPGACVDLPGNFACYGCKEGFNLSGTKCVAAQARPRQNYRQRYNPWLWWYFFN